MFSSSTDRFYNGLKRRHTRVIDSQRIPIKLNEIKIQDNIKNKRHSKSSRMFDKRYSINKRYNFINTATGNMYSTSKYQKYSDNNQCIPSVKYKQSIVSQNNLQINSNSTSRINQSKLTTNYFHQQKIFKTQSKQSIQIEENVKQNKIYGGIVGSKWKIQQKQQYNAMKKFQQLQFLYNQKQNNKIQDSNVKNLMNLIIEKTSHSIKKSQTAPITSNFKQIQVHQHNNPNQNTQLPNSQQQQIKENPINDINSLVQIQTPHIINKPKPEIHQYKNNKQQPRKNEYDKIFPITSNQKQINNNFSQQLYEEPIIDIQPVSYLSNVQSKQQQSYQYYEEIIPQSKIQKCQIKRQVVQQIIENNKNNKKISQKLKKQQKQFKYYEQIKPQLQIQIPQIEIAKPEQKIENKKKMEEKQKKQEKQLKYDEQKIEKPQIQKWQIDKKIPEQKQPNKRKADQKIKKQQKQLKKQIKKQTKKQKYVDKNFRNNKYYQNISNQLDEIQQIQLSFYNQGNKQKTNIQPNPINKKNDIQNNLKPTQNTKTKLKPQINPPNPAIATQQQAEKLPKNTINPIRSSSSKIKQHAIQKNAQQQQSNIKKSIQQNLNQIDSIGAYCIETIKFNVQYKINSFNKQYHIMIFYLWQQIYYLRQKFRQILSSKNQDLYQISQQQLNNCSQDLSNYIINVYKKIQKQNNKQCKKQIQKYHQDALPYLNSSQKCLKIDNNVNYQDKCALYFQKQFKQIEKLYKDAIKNQDIDEKAYLERLCSIIQMHSSLKYLNGEEAEVQEVLDEGTEKFCYYQRYRHLMFG